VLCFRFSLLIATWSHVLVGWRSSYVVGCTVTFLVRCGFGVFLFWVNAVILGLLMLFIVSVVVRVGVIWCPCFALLAWYWQVIVVGACACVCACLRLCA